MGRLGISEPSIVASTQISFTRTAAAGGGAQAITGVGFRPTAIIIMAGTNGADEVAWGVGDDAVGENHLALSSGLVRGDNSDIINLTEGTNVMRAALQSLDSDGFTLFWIKANSGVEVNEGLALCLR